jgi:hypothetical protein
VPRNFANQLFARRQIDRLRPAQSRPKNQNRARNREKDLDVHGKTLANSAALPPYNAVTGGIWPRFRPEIAVSGGFAYCPLPTRRQP